MSLIGIELDQTGGVRDRVTNAIASASRRTGMDFAYLLGQAKLESSLNPAARATTSSATGLYQFLDQSWLAVVKQHGTENGLGWAANAIQKNSNGRYYVADAETRKQILDLRKHPETASVMAAEHAADNKARLESRLGRQVESVDLYLAHFLGSGGATKFLRNFDQNPDARAASLFPAAARANRRIFYDRQGEPRSLAEIRGIFAKKLNSSGSGAIQMASRAVPKLEAGGADFARAQAARLTRSVTEATYRPQPETARLAYLMLATFGR